MASAGRRQRDAGGVVGVRVAGAGATPATDWTQPQYYSTIQTFDLAGDGSQEVLARFADGMHIYRYTPPAGTKSIDGGTWSLVSGTNPNTPTPPFSDADGWTDPSLVHDDPDRALRRRQSELRCSWSGARAAGWTGYRWYPSFGWGERSPPTTSRRSSRTPDAGRRRVTRRSGARRRRSELRPARGPQRQRAQHANQEGADWGAFPGSAQSSVPGPIPANGVFSDMPAGRIARSATQRGLPGFESGVLRDARRGRLRRRRPQRGLRPHRRRVARLRLRRVEVPAGPLDRPADADRAGRRGGERAAGQWGSIRTGDINDDQRDEVLALDANGLEAYNYQPSSKTWSQLPGNAGSDGGVADQPGVLLDDPGR